MHTNKLRACKQPHSVWIWMILAAVLGSLAEKCNAACYFSTELQGVFVTQSTVSENEVTYSQINITDNAIPIWGYCHRRMENNVILLISSGTEETNCFRCFNIRLVASSKNVVRVHTTDADYISKCYTNEEKAVSSCPTEADLQDPSRNTEIILYKTRNAEGGSIQRDYCPISGRFKMAYSMNDGFEGQVACQKQKSEIDTCPSGSSINIRFRECSFDSLDVTFECIGHWVGMDNQNYLVLMNTRSREKLGPQYRCATYSEDPNTGVVSLNFSNDSTCFPLGRGRQTGIYNEMMSLYPVAHSNWPQASSYCRFPRWMKGRWQYLKLHDESTLVFNDHSSFKTHTMKCMENPTTHPDRFLVYSAAQCGETNYYCVEIKKRSTNILEFQIGSRSASTYDTELCDDKYFADDRWLTQGRSEVNSSLEVTPCPVSGEFNGLIPDAIGLCAKLSSECKSQDVMYYEVSACDYDEVYEEREYRCLGQWEEKGVVYVYTQRRDIDAYECFVGVMKSDQKIFIKEAGEHCQRNLNPYKHGMELHKQAFCNDLAPHHGGVGAGAGSIPSTVEADHGYHVDNNNNNQLPQLPSTTYKTLIHTLGPNGGGGGGRNSNRPSMSSTEFESSSSDIDSNLTSDDDEDRKHKKPISKKPAKEGPSSACRSSWLSSGAIIVAVMMMMVMRIVRSDTVL